MGFETESKSFPVGFDAAGPRGPQGPQGKPGKSSYDIAVENGYTGTEEDFTNLITKITDFQAALDAKQDKLERIDCGTVTELDK